MRVVCADQAANLLSGIYELDRDDGSTRCGATCILVVSSSVICVSVVPGAWTRLQPARYSLIFLRRRSSRSYWERPRPVHHSPADSAVPQGLVGDQISYMPRWESRLQLPHVCIHNPH